LKYGTTSPSSNCKLLLDNVEKVEMLMSYMIGLIGRFVQKALKGWQRQQRDSNPNIKIGRSSEVFAKLDCDKLGMIEIGENCFIGELCSITANGSNVKIGNGVLVGPGTVMHTIDHCFARTDMPIWKQGVYPKPIIIEDDVWIGANCTILAGARIGAHSVIGAHSLIIGNIPPFSIAYGIPCKVHRYRNSIESRSSAK
jgi:acetyltransferase-like isoleucine patch superfamily enzyme